jgi:hypothetical protein
MWGRRELSYWVLVGKLKEKEHMEDLGSGGVKMHH